MESIPDTDINICHTVIFVNALWHRSGPLLASEKRIQIALRDPYAPPQSVHDQFALGDPTAHLAFGDWQSSLLKFWQELPGGVCQRKESVYVTPI